MTTRSPSESTAATTAIAAIFGFLGAYDQKWREASEFVVRRKGLHPGSMSRTR